MFGAAQKLDDSRPLHARRRSLAPLCVRVVRTDRVLRAINEQERGNGAEFRAAPSSALRLLVVFLCHRPLSHRCRCRCRPCLSARLRRLAISARLSPPRFQLSSAKPIIMVTTITLHTNQNMPCAVVFFADFTIQTIILIIAVDARDPSSTVHHLDSLHHHR
ncbi:hypothetical protein Y032_0456g1782 [Ancylostoma ceylanicum]|uniref:Uncharacterized protein n=1 Tax=Ancylostoma ceylanicum TaxID=53326 RepID=A0A016WY83_9BILA|nr:hypothetical protein Y032_0456g1782 [Ancylostoma ceylanicum]